MGIARQRAVQLVCRWRVTRCCSLAPPVRCSKRVSARGAAGDLTASLLGDVKVSSPHALCAPPRTRPRLHVRRCPGPAPSLITFESQGPWLQSGSSGHERQGGRGQQATGSSSTPRAAASQSRHRHGRRPRQQACHRRAVLQEQQRHAPGAHNPHRVALKRFNFDDLSTKIGQHLTGKRRCNCARHFKDPNIPKRSAHINSLCG